MSEHGSFSNEPTMSARRHVAVLGPIPRDRITTHRGEVFEKYGCALYTVAALSALLDAHGPTCALVIEGERRRRLWVERDSWLPHVDILKMNVEEAGCSWFPSRDALEHHDAGAPISVEELPRFAEHCLHRGVQAVCVTLDEQGCAAYWLDESGELTERVVPRVPVEHVVDTTGCGDSFAAGMAYGYLHDGDIVRAAQYGNAMGAQRCSGSGLDVYLPLPETGAQLARAYGAAAGFGA